MQKIVSPIVEPSVNLCIYGHGRSLIVYSLCKEMEGACSSSSYRRNSSSLINIRFQPFIVPVVVLVAAASCLIYKTDNSDIKCVFSGPCPVQKHRLSLLLNMWNGRLGRAAKTRTTNDDDEGTKWKIFNNLSYQLQPCPVQEWSLSAIT